METTGLTIGVAQAVVQLAGVVRRHVIAYTTLHDMAASIESKELRSHAAVQELSILLEVSGIRSVLFSHALKDLNEVQQHLNSVQSLIDNSAHTGRFLQAPVLSKSLEEADSKLSQLEHFFRTIGILGSMISSLQSEVRALVRAALTPPKSVTESSEGMQQFLQKIESQVRGLSRTPNNSIMRGEGRIAFATGLAIYGDRVGKLTSAFEPLHPLDLHRAVRLFRKACGLGVKEAYRHLGDLYYDGHGVESCYRTAVELYREGATRNDAAAKFKLGWCYEFGQGVDKDLEKCVELYKESVCQGWVCSNLDRRQPGPLLLIG